MKNRSKRQLIVSAGLTLILLIVSAAIYKKLEANKKSTVSNKVIQEDIRSVRTKTFDIKNVNATVNVDGRINAYEKISIASQVQGILVDIGKPYKEGSTFKKGDLLFKVDDEKERYNLFSQRAALLTAITQMMPDLKFDYPASFPKWQAYLDAFDVSAPLAPLPVVTDKSEKYYIAGKNIETQYYNIKRLEDVLEDHNVYAPFSGVFTSLTAFPGSVVSTGSALGMIMNTSKYELQAPIAAKDLQYIKAGQKVKLISDDLGRSWNGTVSRVSTQIDQATQNIPVYINVYGAGLRDGMYLKGSLAGSSLNDVMEIPTNLLVDQTNVYVLSDSVLVKKPIDIVNRSEKAVWVRGLSGDDLIVSAGVNSLYEGQRAKTL